MQKVFSALLALALGLAAGCRPATPAPTETPAPAPTGVIVNPYTAAPLATPTLPYDPLAVEGRWLLDFRFDFTEGAIIDQTYFVLAIGADVAQDGAISGRGEVAVTVRDAECAPRVTAGNDFGATLRGRVEAQGGDVYLVVQLSPEDGMLMQSYEVYCPDTYQAYTSQLLWQALRKANVREFRIPAEPGAEATLTSPIVFPADPALNWEMQVTVRASR